MTTQLEKGKMAVINKSSSISCGEEVRLLKLTTSGEGTSQKGTKQYWLVEHPGRGYLRYTPEQLIPVDSTIETHTSTLSITIPLKSIGAALFDLATEPIYFF